MRSFETATEAQAFVRHQVDVPIAERMEAINNGMQLHAFSYQLDRDRFTNVYDLRYRAEAMRPAIRVYDRLTNIYDFARTHRKIAAVTGGGFFFLADRCSGVPRQLALNFSIANGRVRSFPVVDREAVMADDGNMWVEKVQALGVLSLNGKDISWSGSLTDHVTDVKIFGNGNAKIEHHYNESTGTVRVLDEKSRLTPPIEIEGVVDVGFVRRGDGAFLAAATSRSGGLDIFAHDVVVRGDEKYLGAQSTVLKLKTIGDRAIGGALRGALSVGPSLDTADFETHPVNKDVSLGSNPPFANKPLARMALYETDDGFMHLRLFDGRPGSAIFPGVTPLEAVKSIQEEGRIAWGCFLDPGQTAKLCVRTADGVKSFGNTHYLRWPVAPDGRYVWVPKAGRPLASAITLQWSL